MPPNTKTPNVGVCSLTAAHGCDYDDTAAAGAGCDAVHAKGGAGAAMRDHPIFAVTWSLPGEHDGGGGAGEAFVDEGGEVVDVAQLTLSSGVAASPLVWAPRLTSPLGAPLAADGLRVVNRTGTYRCHE